MEEKMKKLFAISLLLMFSFITYAEARVQYDSTGRKIINDDTLRGRKRAAENQAYQHSAAAAAKIDYDKALKDLGPTNLKPNYYQKR